MFWETHRKPTFTYHRNGISNDIYIYYMILHDILTTLDLVQSNFLCYFHDIDPMIVPSTRRRSSATAPGGAQRHGERHGGSPKWLVCNGKSHQNG